MGRHNRDVPKGWMDVPAMGARIANTPFVCFKVPLKDAVFRGRYTQEHWFTTTHVLQRVALMGADSQLHTVINLSNTDRHYDVKDFERMMVEHHWLSSYDNDTALSPLYDRFKEVMQRFDSLHGGDESLIVGVTDDRGVEKCAYVICRYLVECKSYALNDAIRAFNEARGVALTDERTLAAIRGADGSDQHQQSSETQHERARVVEQAINEGHEMAAFSMLGAFWHSQQCTTYTKNAWNGFGNRDDSAAPQPLSVRGRRNKRSAWEETAAVCRVMGNAAHALVHFMQMLLARNEHQQRDVRRENRQLMREWKRAQRQAALQDAAEAAEEEEEEIEEEQPSTSQQQADEIAYAFASGVEQTAEERRAAAMELGGKVECDPRKTSTRKRRARRHRLQKLHAKMRRGKFWEIREMLQQHGIS